MTESNPYTPPVSEALSAGDDPAALGELVRAWEKLRLLYNGIMILPGLAVLSIWVGHASMPVPVAAVSGLIGGVGANAAFFLGPLSELYLRGLFRQGAPIGRGRWLIFAAGLAVSAGVFVVAAAIPISVIP